MKKFYSLIAALLLFAGFASAAAPERYEWWLDSDIGTLHTGTFNGGVLDLDIETETLSSGVHSFNLRLSDSDGHYGAVYRKIFVNLATVADTEAVAYEYWMDNDYAGRKSAFINANPAVFEVDLSNYSMRGGLHYFNLRILDSKGAWSTVYRKEIFAGDNDPRAHILGFRHYINGTYAGYVGAEPTSAGKIEMETELPDSLVARVKGLAPVFEGDKVSLAGVYTLDYLMQLHTDRGWAAPQKWTLPVENKYSTTAVEMAENSRHTFDTPAAGEFVAVKFTASASTLYFRSDVPVACDIYRDGVKKASITPDLLFKTFSLRLEEGEYFCLLYDAEGDAENLTFYIMDTHNIVPAPEIDFKEGMVNITCRWDDAEIKYTIDDETDPSPEDGTEYKGQFSLERNATIKAIAYIPDSDVEPSEVVSYTVDSYTVPVPYGEFDSATRLLTILCDKENASKFYSFSLGEDWTPYTTPIAIDRNRTVYARATFPGYNDSEIAEIPITELKCGNVKITGYNGRYLTLSTSEEDASIMYRPDSSGDWQEYTSPVDVERLCMVRAIVVKPGCLDSEPTEYQVEYYGDETHAETSAGGMLESCYGWDDGSVRSAISTLSVEGTLDESDYAFLRSLGSLRHLDLGKVADARIPEEAFAGTRLISLAMPETIAAQGSRILADCDRLSAVIWNTPGGTLPAWVTADITNHNLLVYVPAGTDAGSAAAFNVVTGEAAATVTLRHGYPFHAPRAFHAGRVEYTRDFSLRTYINECGGWETITLPFAPDSIVHATSGAITPFAAWDGDVTDKKPFWLYASAAGGWTAAAEIEARKPYIISMPNNPWTPDNPTGYVDNFNLAGSVTFIADDVTLGPDSSKPLTTEWMEGMWLRGTFQPAEEPDVIALNVHEEDENVRPGSRFVGNETAAPFEAYVGNTSGRMAVPVFGEWGALELPVAGADGLSVDSPSHGTIRIRSDRDRKVDILTVDGARVCSVDVRAHETKIVTGLMRNYYICSGVKVPVR